MNTNELETLIGDMHANWLESQHDRKQKWMADPANPSNWHPATQAAYARSMLAQYVRGSMSEFSHVPAADMHEAICEADWADLDAEAVKGIPATIFAGVWHEMKRDHGQR